MQIGLKLTGQIRALAIALGGAIMMSVDRDVHSGAGF